MTTLKDIFKFSSLNLNNLLVSKDSGTCLDHIFEVSPMEFLNFAKEDLSENTKRGYLNALTNSKRAIDCQVDAICQSIGFSHTSTCDTRGTRITLKNFVDWYDGKEGTIENAQLNLKLVRALGMAPAGLIGKVRQLRHDLEHNYQVPDKNSVKEAVELVELFIGTTQTLKILEVE